MTLNKDTYSIRQVIELTGVTEFLLRIWELRYKAISPQRTESGRRLYSPEDVLKIASLNTLCSRGYRIGKIAKLSTPELQNLIKESFLETDSTTENSNQTAQPKDSHLDQKLKKLFDLLAKGKWTHFKNQYYKLAEAHTAVENIFEMILPLIKNMNELVAHDKLSIAQEHFITALLKEHLQKIKAEQFSAPTHGNKKFILATPEGDIHDLGLLIASALTSTCQIESLYLGPHVPKKDLAETCLQFKATHLLLVSTVSETEGAKENILTYLNFIERNSPKNLKIWIAGRNTHQLPEKALKEILVLKSFKDFYALINKGTK